VLNLVFKIADDNGLLLLDMKDLRAMLQYVGDNSKDFTTEYGNVSAASIGAIQRGLMQIEEQGGDRSSANRCSTSATSCRRSTARASSTSWPPTS
jgi:DNA helicase HerA-like ATPase